MSLERDRTNEVATVNAEQDAPAITEDQGSREEVQSRHGSITYPYQSRLNETSFSRCEKVTAPICSAEIYTRSLLRLGHGIPLWDPIGNVKRNKLHVKSSVMIGDVGFIDSRGDFSYYFNIFLPSTAPAQRRCPPDFQPLVPPLSLSELITKPNHFPTQTTFVSPGVDTNCASTSPWDITFTVNAREGAVLLLPDGASREDLVSTERVRDYVLQHAQNWYQYINRTIEYRVMCPNGSLCIVTGHDKATSWAVSVSPPYNDTGELRKVRFTGGKRNQTFKTDMVSRDSWAKANYDIDHCAIFVRTMRVALTERNWIKHILHNNPPESIAFYYMPTVPIFGLRAIYQRLKERVFKKIPDDYLDENLSCSEHAFHPLAVVLQFLLVESPSSRMAFIEDSVWNAVASTTDGSLSSTSSALVKLLLSHKISNENLAYDDVIIEYVTLKPLATSSSDDPPSINAEKPPFNILNVLKHGVRSRLQQMVIASKLSKIFPGPGIPSRILKREHKTEEE